MVDQIYYINLDYRTDRRFEMEEWLEESGVPSEKITRISAIHTPGAGHLGCLASHSKALIEFLKSPYKTCIILEDDYVPIDIKTYWASINQVFEHNVNFDLVMLSYNKLQSDPTEFSFLHRVKFSYTTSGYLITKDFAPKLLENFREALTKCLEFEKENQRKGDDFCADIYWMKLMPVSNWYCIYPRVGKQRASFSDLQGHYTDYNA